MAKLIEALQIFAKYKDVDYPTNDQCQAELLAKYAAPEAPKETL